MRGLFTLLSASTKTATLIQRLRVREGLQIAPVTCADVCWAAHSEVGVKAEPTTKCAMAACPACSLAGRPFLPPFRSSLRANQHACGTYVILQHASQKLLADCANSDFSDFSQSMTPQVSTRNLQTLMCGLRAGATFHPTLCPGCGSESKSGCSRPR